MDNLPPPQITHWGFNAPRKELLKIIIDTTIKPIKPLLSPTKTLRSKHAYPFPYLQDSTESPEAQQSSSKDTAPILKENKPPMKGPGFQNFGADKSRGYFGGPILNTITKEWQPTLYTKASGKICFPIEMTGAISLPTNIQTIICSVGVMRGDFSQSGFWIGPRHFLSTLHMHRWITGNPTKQECEVITQSGVSFDVETEIHSRLLGTDRDGPKLKLVGAVIEQDIGCFQLLDSCSDQAVWADIDWIMDRDEAGKSSLNQGMQMACVGFNGRIRQEDRIKIVEQAERTLQHKLPDFSNPLQGFDLDEHVKAETRCMAPGTLDRAEANESQILYGVSSSLWHGSSGGPCVVLEGKEAGRIIGLVQGQQALADPYNIINGMPAGLVPCIKNFMKSSGG